MFLISLTISQIRHVLSLLQSLKSAMFYHFYSLSNPAYFITFRVGEAEYIDHECISRTEVSGQFSSEGRASLALLFREIQRSLLYVSWNVEPIMLERYGPMDTQLLILP